MRNGITLCRGRVAARWTRWSRSLGLIFGGVTAIWLILKEGDKDGAGGGGETEEWRGNRTEDE